MSTDMRQWIAPPDRTRRLPIAIPDSFRASYGRIEVRVPAFGFLEGFDLRLRELAPNMDAAGGFLLTLGLRDLQSAAPGPELDLWAICREIVQPGLGPDPWSTEGVPRAGEARVVCPSCDTPLVLDTQVRTVRR